MSDGENNVDGGVGDTAFYWKDGKPSEFTVSAKKAASKKGGERKAQIKASKPTERPHTIGDAISGDLVAAINHFVSQGCMRFSSFRWIWQERRLTMLHYNMPKRCDPLHVLQAAFTAMLGLIAKEEDISPATASQESTMAVSEPDDSSATPTLAGPTLPVHEIGPGSLPFQIGALYALYSLHGTQESLPKAPIYVDIQSLLALYLLRRRLKLAAALATDALAVLRHLVNEPGNLLLTAFRGPRSLAYLDSILTQTVKAASLKASLDELKEKDGIDAEQARIAKAVAAASATAAAAMGPVDSGSSPAGNNGTAPHQVTSSAGYVGTSTASKWGPRGRMAAAAESVSKRVRCLSEVYAEYSAAIEFTHASSHGPSQDQPAGGSSRENGHAPNDALGSGSSVQQRSEPMGTDLGRIPTARRYERFQRDLAAMLQGARSRPSASPSTYGLGNLAQHPPVSRQSSPIPSYSCTSSFPDLPLLPAPSMAPPVAQQPSSRASVARAASASVSASTSTTAPASAAVSRSLPISTSVATSGEIPASSSGSSSASASRSSVVRGSVRHSDSGRGRHARVGVRDHILALQKELDEQEEDEDEDDEEEEKQAAIGANKTSALAVAATGAGQGIHGFPGMTNRNRASTLPGMSNMGRPRELPGMSSGSRLAGSGASLPDGLGNAPRVSSEGSGGQSLPKKAGELVGNPNASANMSTSVTRRRVGPTRGAQSRVRSRRPPGSVDVTSSSDDGSSINGTVDGNDSESAWEHVTSTASTGTGVPERTGVPTGKRSSGRPRRSLRRCADQMKADENAGGSTRGKGGEHDEPHGDVIHMEASDDAACSRNKEGQRAGGNEQKEGMSCDSSSEDEDIANFERFVNNITCGENAEKDMRTPSSIPAATLPIPNPTLSTDVGKSTESVLVGAESASRGPRDNDRSRSTTGHRGGTGRRPDGRESKRAGRGRGQASAAAVEAAASARLRNEREASTSEAERGREAQTRPDDNGSSNEDEDIADFERFVEDMSSAVRAEPAAESGTSSTPNKRCRQVEDADDSDVRPAASLHESPVSKKPRSIPRENAPQAPIGNTERPSTAKGSSRGGGKGTGRGRAGRGRGRPSLTSAEEAAAARLRAEREDAQSKAKQNRNKRVGRQQEDESSEDDDIAEFERFVESMSSTTATQGTTKNSASSSLPRSNQSSEQHPESVSDNGSVASIPASQTSEANNKIASQASRAKSAGISRGGDVRRGGRGSRGGRGKGRDSARAGRGSGRASAAAIEEAAAARLQSEQARRGARASKGRGVQQASGEANAEGGTSSEDDDIAEFERFVNSIAPNADVEQSSITGEAPASAPPPATFSAPKRRVLGQDNNDIRIRSRVAGSAEALVSKKSSVNDSCTSSRAVRRGGETRRGGRAGRAGRAGGAGGAGRGGGRETRREANGRSRRSIAAVEEAAAARLRKEREAEESRRESSASKGVETRTQEDGTGDSSTEDEDIAEFERFVTSVSISAHVDAQQVADETLAASLLTDESRCADDISDSTIPQTTSGSHPDAHASGVVQETAATMATASSARGKGAPTGRTARGTGSQLRSRSPSVRASSSRMRSTQGGESAKKAPVRAKNTPKLSSFWVARPNKTSPASRMGNAVNSRDTSSQPERDIRGASGADAASGTDTAGDGKIAPGEARVAPQDTDKVCSSIPEPETGQLSARNWSALEGWDGAETSSDSDGDNEAHAGERKQAARTTNQSSATAGESGSSRSFDKVAESGGGTRSEHGEEVQEGARQKQDGGTPESCRSSTGRGTVDADDNAARDHHDGGGVGALESRRAQDDGASSGALQNGMGSAPSGQMQQQDELIGGDTSSDSDDDDGDD